MKCWIVLLLVVGSPIFVSAQYCHRLAASEFTGKPPADNDYLAFTHCNVVYTYQVIHSNNQYHIDFNVDIAFDKNLSYIRFNQITNNDMMLHVLRHEQGHYNIAWLMRCELYTVLKRHHYSANYEQEITYLFNQVSTKYHKINDDYERQTEHMLNDTNQDKWNAWFAKVIENSSIRA